MRVVDILPVQLGVVMYPEHEKVKSLLIDEIKVMVMNTNIKK